MHIQLGRPMQKGMSRASTDDYTTSASMQAGSDIE
jgi:hypothetical protein